MLTEQTIWTIGLCLVGKEIWFTSADFNGLFRADIKTGEVKFVSQISILGKNQELSFSCIIQKDEFLYLCPFVSNCICEYNMNTNTMQFFFLDDVKEAYVNRAFCVKDKIFMFCDQKHMVVIFDLADKKISYVKKYGQEKHCYDKIQDIVCVEETFFFADGCRIIETDLQLKRRAEYDMSKYSERKEIETIAFSKNCFWLLCGKTTLLFWNKEEDKVYTYTVPDLGTARKSYINEQVLYIFYPDTNRILIFNMEDKDVIVVHTEKFGYQIGQPKIFLPFLKESTEGIYFYSYVNSGINLLKPNGELTSVKLFMRDMDSFLIDYIGAGFYHKGEAFYENQKYFGRLDYFLNCINKENVEKSFEETENEVGSLIYNKIKESTGSRNDNV